VTVQQGVSMSNLAALEAGEIDIAVVFEPGGQTKNEVVGMFAIRWIDVNARPILRREHFRSFGHEAPSEDTAMARHNDNRPLVGDRAMAGQTSGEAGPGAAGAARDRPSAR
jgi:DNA-binding transcriptional LysR family regulator